MNVIRKLKRYKKRVEKRFTHQISREQLNFACDERIILGIKMLAQDLEVPMYPLCEHLLQAGMAEASLVIRDEALKENLCRHLVKDHLLTPITNPESEITSSRAWRLDNAMRLLEYIEFDPTP